MEHSQHLGQTSCSVASSGGPISYLDGLFSQSGFMPHGHCYLWKPSLVAAHTISDVMIGLAYVSIAVSLYLLVRRIRAPYSSMLLSFGLFIGACGATHFMEVWNLWHADYWVSAWLKVLTAGASVATAIVLIRNRRSIQSTAEAAKVAKQKHLDLESLTKDLERLVQERTQELARATERAEAANRAKTEFLANMSHEIRTPLGAVLGFAELLRDPSLSLEERARFAEIVDRNGRQLSRLISDILDLSKIEAGKLEIEYAIVSFPSLVAEVASLLRSQAVAKNIRLRVQPMVGIPELVCTDPTRLRQIILNVIGNAIKFTQQGEVSVAIAIKEERGDEQRLISIQVRDTGVGISSENQSKLFHAFSQGDSSMTRKFGGTGLGLVVSRHLAQALGGDVVLVESAPGRGALFEITFLVKAAASFVEVESQKGVGAAAFPAPVLEPTVELAKATQAPALQGVKVLVAEDSPDNQMLFNRMLASQGARIDFVSNGDEAVRMALEGDYDLVLMDIQMPVMNGHEATKELRARGFTKPIIALTAHALSDERNRSLEVGCNDHVTKPLTRQKLIETIQRFA